MGTSWCDREGVGTGLGESSSCMPYRSHMILMSNEEVAQLAFGGATTTAGALRIFAGLAFVGGVIGGLVGFLAEPRELALGVYLLATGLLSASVLSAFAWVIDLLRGILAGVWQSAWMLDDDEDDEDG